MAAEIVTSKLYHGDAFIGEVCICLQCEDASLMGNISEGLHISHFSCPSKRCPPLVVLHSIAVNGVCFKMESKEQQSQHVHTNLKSLYDVCLQEEKTAIVPVGKYELHLVAMLSGDRDKDVPRFWGFCVEPGLYGSCLGMLNLRCLAIVFDLDETLVVANTMRSFEDRIEALRRKKLGEVDPQRASGISAEIKRYQEDKRILKQFIESDQVFNNGKMIRAQSEIVAPASDTHLPLVRPIIRLHGRNIILTRINPNVRDTSVLVRMRPAWEELRHYLIANGRKRFEVFICTMSEKDYALEMWRLLDPESSLISPQELKDRVICVKPGLKKSLLDVFHNGLCHPKIALVIDDRLKVWEDRDQSRVHVVPAFAPYYTPLAETSVPVPILCVARNVACNVRGSFYKDFDEGLLQRMAGVFYENDVTNLPVSPDVCNYLVTQDEAVANANNTNLNAPYTMENSEVENKLDLQDKNLLTNTTPACALMKNQDPKLFIQPLQKGLPVTSPCDAQVQVSEKVREHSIGISAGSEQNSNGSPVREEGEIPESDLDPDTRRRLLILQHGQDPGQRDFNSYNPPILVSMAQSNLPPNQHLAGLVRGKFPQLSKQSQGLSLGLESQTFDVQHLMNSSFYNGLESSLPSNRNACVFIRQPPRKRFCGDDNLKNEPRLHDYSSPGNHMPKLGSAGPGGCIGHNGWVEKQARDLQTSMGYIGVSMDDDKPVASTSGQSQHVNPGYANHYMENANNEKGEVQPSRGTGSSMGYVGGPCVDEIKIASISAQGKIPDQSRDDNSKGSYDPVVALEELCIKEGLDLVFENQKSNGVDNTMESYAQVEVAGQILGKGCHSTWEEAKLQAAEEALKNLEASSNQWAQKRLNSSSRTLQDGT